MCITGTPNCTNSLCGFIVDGAIVEGIVLDNSSTVSFLSLGSCPRSIPIATAIGGGGSGSNGKLPRKLLLKIRILRYYISILKAVIIIDCLFMIELKIYLYKVVEEVATLNKLSWN